MRVNGVNIALVVIDMGGDMISDAVLIPVTLLVSPDMTIVEVDTRGISKKLVAELEETRLTFERRRANDDRNSIRLG